MEQEKAQQSIADQAGTYLDGIEYGAVDQCKDLYAADGINGAQDADEQAVQILHTEESLCDLLVRMFLTVGNIETDEHGCEEESHGKEHVGFLRTHAGAQLVERSHKPRGQCIDADIEDPLFRDLSVSGGTDDQIDGRKHDQNTGHLHESDCFLPENKTDHDGNDHGKCSENTGKRHGPCFKGTDAENCNKAHTETVAKRQNDRGGRNRADPVTDQGKRSADQTGNGVVYMIIPGRTDLSLGENVLEHHIAHGTKDDD